MKRPQLLGVAIAGVCGLAAFFGVMSLVNRQPTVVREEVQTNTTQVLVAKSKSASGRSPRRRISAGRIGPKAGSTLSISSGAPGPMPSTISLVL